MAASVTVHHKAFSDPRLLLLAKLGGYDVDSALGKMTRLWSAMTELGTDYPPVEMIRACLGGLDGDKWLVQCGLGEIEQDGALRVRGRFEEATGRDRLEWYSELHQRNVKGGKARAASAPRDVRGRLLPATSQAPQPAPASDPIPDSLSGSSPSPELPDPDLDPPGDRDREPHQPPQLEIVHPLRDPVDLAIANPGPTRSLGKLDLRRRLFGEAWNYCALKHFELKAAGIDDDARSCWGGLPVAGSFESNELFARVDELIIGDTPDVERAREVLRNRIEVAAAEARHKLGHLRFFTPTAMWNAKSFAIASSLTPAQVEAAARASPNARTKHAEPVRHIPKLINP